MKAKFKERDILIHPDTWKIYDCLPTSLKNFSVLFNGEYCSLWFNEDANQFIKIGEL